MKKTLLTVLLAASGIGAASAAVSTNALSINALSINALSINRLAFNRLAFNGVIAEEARMLKAAAILADQPLAKKKH